MTEEYLATNVRAWVSAVRGRDELVRLRDVAISRSEKADIAMDSSLVNLGKYVSADEPKRHIKVSDGAIVTIRYMGSNKVPCAEIIYYETLP